VEVSSASPQVEETVPPTPTDPPPAPIPEPAGLSQIYVEYILDASGSMMETLQGKTRLEIAQQVMAERMRALPPNTQVGLRVYGHRVPYQQEAESCQDIELVVPIQPRGAEAIIEWLPTMQAQGMTPISESLRFAAADFTFEPGRKNFIVLISDGEETCGDDPATMVGYLKEVGIEFTIHVIGLDVDETTRQQLGRIAQAAGGVYHDADSEEDLAAALGRVNEDILTSPPADSEVVQNDTTPTTAVETAPAATQPPTQGANTFVTSEGVVEASSIYDANYPTSLALDGDPSTSWFSAGPESDGTSTFRWTGGQEDLIASIEIVSNEVHQVVDFRTGYGFEAVSIQVLDAEENVVYEEEVGLPGTPDPNITVRPNVTGRSILLTFTGSEALDCGGFAELRVGVVR
jgi:hypothetical protein